MAAALRLENLISRLRKQSGVLALHSSLFLTISLFLLWRVKFIGLMAPTWLLGFERHLSAALVLLALASICLRFYRGAAALRSDWLAVQPIAFAQRLAWLRAKIAARTLLELGVYAALAAGLCGAFYGFGVLISGASLSLIALIFLPFNQTVRQAKPAEYATPSIRGANSSSTKFSATKRTDAANTGPFNAWFASAIPRLSKLRWWWLIPLLALPMGSQIMLIAAIFAGFLALSRFAAVCSALSIALADISKLTHTTPLRPARLYRAALLFSAQGVLIVALMAIALALSPAKLSIALLALVVGLLLISTALHFGFGYRLEAMNGAARARASLLIALLLGLTANSMPMLLPVACALLWFWLYRRGSRLGNTLLDTN